MCLLMAMRARDQAQVAGCEFRGGRGWLRRRGSVRATDQDHPPTPYTAPVIQALMGGSVRLQPHAQGIHVSVSFARVPLVPQTVGPRILRDDVGILVCDDSRMVRRIWPVEEEGDGQRPKRERAPLERVPLQRAPLQHVPLSVRC